MIGDLTAGVSVSYPDVDTEGLSDAIRVKVQEVDGEHTFISIEHYGVPVRFSTSLRTGSPILLTTMSRYGKKTWPAYVIDVRPAAAMSNTENITEVRALGVTYPAKKTSTRVLSGRTVGDYIDEIVYGMGLVPFVEESHLRQTLPQAGRSDWEVLRELCEMGSLHLFSSGTTVHALTSTGSISTFFYEAPTMYYLPREDVLSQPDALESLVYGHKDMQRARVQARSVDPESARVISASAGEGLFTDFGSTMSATSLIDLKTKVERKSRSALSSYTARTSGPGNILVSAGRPVYLNDTGVGKWWIATEVTHHFTPDVGTFTTDAVLWRDSSFPEEQPPPPAPLQQGTRSTPRFCTCREHEPLLVGSLRSNYITNQTDTINTEQTSLSTEEVSQWLDSSPHRTSTSSLMGSGVDTKRWRARGRCNWL